MRMTRHGEHLLQLTRYPALFPMNCYLIKEEDGAATREYTSRAWRARSCTSDRMVFFRIF